MLALAALAPSLSAGFVYDDQILVVDRHLGPDRVGFLTALRDDLFGRDAAGRPASGYWRPLVQATYALEARIFDGHPLPYHLHNLLLHALNAVLLTLLLSRLGAGRFAATVAGALFAVHPIHVESLAPVSGRTDAYAALFLLLAAHAQLGGRRVLAVFASALALLAKESAVALVPLVFLLGRSRERDWRKALVAVAACALAAGAFLLFSRFGLGIVPPESAWHGEGGAFARLITFVAALPTYALWLLWPPHLSIVHPFPLATGMGDPRLVLGAACLLALFWALSSAPAVLRAAAAAILLGLLPVSNLVPITYAFDFLPFPLFERYLYLPSLGWAAAAAWAIDLLRRRGRGWRGAAWAVAAALIVAYGLRAAAYAAVWHDDASLYLHALGSVPEGSRARRQLSLQQAWAAFRAGDVDAALSRLDALLAERPADAEAAAAKATLLAVLAEDARGRARAHRDAGLDEAGDAWEAISERLLEKAERTLRPAREASPKDGRLWEAEGLCALARNDLLEAARDLAAAWEAGGASPALPDNLRRVAERIRAEARRRAEGGLESLPDALGFLERGVRALCGTFPPRHLPGPIRGPVLRLLAEHADDLVLAGRFAQAEAAYRRLLAFEPTLVRAYEGLAYLQEHSGRRAEALASLRRALELDPDAFFALNELFTLLMAEGRREEAARVYRRLRRVMEENAAPPRLPLSPPPAPPERGRGAR